MSQCSITMPLEKARPLKTATLRESPMKSVGYSRKSNNDSKLELSRPFDRESHYCRGGRCGPTRKELIMIDRNLRTDTPCSKA